MSTPIQLEMNLKAKCRGAGSKSEEGFSGMTAMTA